MAGRNAPENAVDRLAEEFLARYRKGERPDIDDYVRRLPEAEAAIRELFPTIEALESLRARHDKRSDGLASLGPRKPTRLGGYRIVREIGRGGMGIVYEGLNAAENTTVAVKVLARQSLLSDVYRKRFLREARTAGRLKHPNIVPILGVGEEDGFSFYVMPRIVGAGIDVLLKKLRGLGGTAAKPGTAAAGDSDIPGTALAGVQRILSLFERREKTDAYWRAVARMTLQVAMALQSAHAEGVLHRDIKPGNLLLGEKCDVWVTDFGLAKATEQETLSRSGDVLGTYLYMAPEQWQGTADARSDLFSLGVTLYELLTLKLPFTEEERTEAFNGRRLVPAAPRSIMPSVPAELEEIALKAMAHEPDRRHGSASELVSCLARYLQGQTAAPQKTNSSQQRRQGADPGPEAKARKSASDATS